MFIQLRKIVFRIFLILFLYAHSMDIRASIVTMFKPLGFIAAAIANQITTVEVLIPDSMSAHSYSLRPLDIIKMKNADFLITIGDPIEPLFFNKIRCKFKKKTIQLSTLKSIKPLLIHHSLSVSHFTQKNHKISNKKNMNTIDYDMHIWLSPKIAIEAAIAIHQQLKKIIPEKKNVIDQNLYSFKLNILKTNSLIKKHLVFFTKKKYFSFHNAYRYFEKHYKLSSVGYFTKYLDIPISAKSLYDIKKTLIEKKVKCIFIEPHMHTRIIDIIIYNTNIKKGLLDPLGIETSLDKNSYMKYILGLSSQYTSCFQQT